MSKEQFNQECLSIESLPKSVVTGTKNVTVMKVPLKQVRAELPKTSILMASDEGTVEEGED